jgi:hypothetical protein
MYSLAPRVGTKTLHCLWWKVTNTQISQKTEENEWNVFLFDDKCATLWQYSKTITGFANMCTIPIFLVNRWNQEWPVIGYLDYGCNQRVTKAQS